MIIQITELRELYENKANTIRETIIQDNGNITVAQAVELGDYISKLRLLGEPQRAHMVN